MTSEVPRLPTLQPIPETVEAVDNLDPSADDGTLLSGLTRLARHGREIVPDLIGVSIAPFQDGLTFTLVASTEEIAVLDAVQYAAGGPCVEGAHTARAVEFEPDVLHEERWRLFAEATAARAVRSTLTLPILGDGRVTGTVNLYAASRRAFFGHHEQLAGVFGAWAAGAVANADLAFTTRREAAGAPESAQPERHRPSHWNRRCGTRIGRRNRPGTPERCRCARWRQPPSAGTHHCRRTRRAETRR